MLELARRTAPKARLLHGDYLTYDLRSAKFHGIFAKAILHLFPCSDAKTFVRKSHEHLFHDGLLFISVGIDGRQREGFFPKTDYRGQAKRYRTYWERGALINVVQEGGFKIAYESVEHEHARAKKWLNICAIPTR